MSNDRDVCSLHSRVCLSSKARFLSGLIGLNGRVVIEGRTLLGEWVWLNLFYCNMITIRSITSSNTYLTPFLGNFEFKK